MFRNSANICLVEHISFPTMEGRMSAASFLHSSFLQTINSVMLWPVHVQKVPWASEHLCPAKLQIRCDIFCACKSVCLFIPSDSSMPKAVDPQKSLQQFEPVRMMACIICVSSWEASHCISCDCFCLRGKTGGRGCLSEASKSQGKRWIVVQSSHGTYKDCSLSWHAHSVQTAKESL